MDGVFKETDEALRALLETQKVSLSETSPDDPRRYPILEEIIATLQELYTNSEEESKSFKKWFEDVIADQLDDLKEESLELHEKYSDVKNENRGLRKELRKLENENEGLCKVVKEQSGLERELVFFKNQYDEIRKELASQSVLSAKLAKSEQANQQLEETMHQKSEEFASMRREFLRKSHEQKQINDTLKTQLDENLAAFKELKFSLTSSQEENANLKKRNQAFWAARLQVEEEKQERERTIKDLVKRLVALEGGPDGMKRRAQPPRMGNETSSQASELADQFRDTSLDGAKGGR